MGWSPSCSCSRPVWTGARSLTAAASGVSTSFTAGFTPWATAHHHRSPGRWRRCSPCGAGAALSHRSAAALWRILARWHSPVEVTAPTKHHLKEIHVHRARHADSTTHYGIRVTTPARTLVDLADVLTPRALTRAVNEAQVLRLTTPTELTTLLTRYPGRRTSPLQPERGATRSHLEDRFIRFLKRHRLPIPELNQQIAGHEVDAVYRPQRLVIELDSRQFHTTPRAFEQDRDRDADLLKAGFSTLRITDQRLKHHATNEAKRLKTILRSRSP
jgi:very-short-patch-repair endonuclease